MEVCYKYLTRKNSRSMTKRLGHLITRKNFYDNLIQKGERFSRTEQFKEIVNIYAWRCPRDGKACLKKSLYRYISRELAVHVYFGRKILHISALRIDWWWFWQGNVDHSGRAMFSEEFAGSLLQRPYDVDLGYGVWKPLPANTTSCACMFHKHGLWPVMHGILALLVCEPLRSQWFLLLL